MRPLSALSAQEKQHEWKKMLMKKIENEMKDELRPEYDLKNLRVRNVGQGG